MIGAPVRRLLLRWATSPPASLALSALARGLPTILMLHRFNHADRGVTGHDPVKLRKLLERLRRDRYAIISLEEMLRHLEQEARFPSRTVAFTLDDGYADQAEVAGPLFAEFDCPATIFVTTGFLDGHLWCWWDQVEFIFQMARRAKIVTDGGPERGRTYDMNTTNGRVEATVSFVHACKTVPDREKQDLIRSLAQAADVGLPTRPPARYAPMSWSQLRELESRGLSFGPHTVTHPILSRAHDEQVHHEIAESWQRLRAEAIAPVAVFCYPNGQAGDFGEREIAFLRQVGLSAAVTGQSGYPNEGPWHETRFRVPRFAYDDEMPTTLQYVNGFERLKQRIRRSR